MTIDCRLNVEIKTTREAIEFFNGESIRPEVSEIGYEALVLLVILNEKVLNINIYYRIHWYFDFIVTITNEAHSFYWNYSIS